LDHKYEIKHSGRFGKGMVEGAKLSAQFMAEAYVGGGGALRVLKVGYVASRGHQVLKAGETFSYVFKGGNAGRIINVLYLVKEGLLDIPVLYLSRYINQHKTRYYELLQKTSVENQWEDYILYMLKCVEETSKQTIEIVRGIRDLMQKQKELMKRELPKIYSQDLLNNIFMHPYTRIDALSEELSVQKKTASQYLSKLEDVGILEKQAFKRRNIYINVELMKLLSGVSKSNNMSSKNTF
jgi:hypothetical protein